MPRSGCAESWGVQSGGVPCRSQTCRPRLHAPLTQSAPLLQEKCLGNVDDLKKQIARLERQDKGNMMAYIPLKYQLPMVDGRGKLDNIQNSRFPGIKPIDMKAYLRKAEDLPEQGY